MPKDKANNKPAETVDELASLLGIDTEELSSPASNEMKLYFICRHVVVEKKVQQVAAELRTQGTKPDYNELRKYAEDEFYKVFGQWDSTSQRMTEAIKISAESMRKLAMHYTGCQTWDELMEWDRKRNDEIQKRMEKNQRL